MVIGWIIAALVTLGLGGFAVWRQRRVAARRAEWEAALTTWRHIGVPPPGVEVALSIIESRCPRPEMKQAVVIEWVDGVFECGTVDAVGCYIGLDRLVRVTYAPLVERTALAHEIGHYYGFKDGDPAFDAWTRETNAAIEAALRGGTR